MRTTIDLSDELIRAVRVRAAERDESLKVLITRALTRELGRPARKRRGELPVIPSRRPGESRLTAEELEESLTGDDIDHLT